MNLRSAVCSLIWFNAATTVAGFFEAPEGVQRNYNEAILWVDNFVKCYDKPYSHATTESDLEQCSDASWVFVGAKQSSARTNFLIGAYGFATTVFTQTKYANLAYEHNGLYWYMKPGSAFGFSSTENVMLLSTDIMDDHNNRLSWSYDNSFGEGGARAAQYMDLEDDDTFRKIIYRLRPTATSPTLSPTEELSKCSVPNEANLGDGYCDMDPYNTKDCGYDRGDCCEETCVSRDYQCGFNGYSCIQPPNTMPTRHPTPAPQPPTMSPTFAPSTPTVNPTLAPTAPTVEPTLIPTSVPSTARPTVHPTLRGTSASQVSLRYSSSFPYGRDEDSYFTVEFPNMNDGDEATYEYLTTVTFSETTKLREDLDYITIYADDRYLDVYGESQYTGSSFPGMNGQAALGFRAYRFVVYFHSGAGEVPDDYGYLMDVNIDRFLTVVDEQKSVSSTSSYLGLSRSSMIGLITCLAVLAVASCVGIPFWYMRARASAKVACEARDRRRDTTKLVREIKARKDAEVYFSLLVLSQFVVSV